MPLILVAGTVVAQPRAEAFPERGRPRCEVRVRVDGDGNAVTYRVIGFDDQMAELETLFPGDSVAIQAAFFGGFRSKSIVSRGSFCGTGFSAALRMVAGQDALARAVFKAAVHHSRSSISVPAGASSSASPASPPW